MRLEYLFLLSFLAALVLVGARLGFSSLDSISGRFSGFRVLSETGTPFIIIGALVGPQVLNLRVCRATSRAQLDPDPGTGHHRVSIREPLRVAPHAPLHSPHVWGGHHRGGVHAVLGDGGVLVRCTAVSPRSVAIPSPRGGAGPRRLCLGHGTGRGLSARREPTSASRGYPGAAFLCCHR